MDRFSKIKLHSDPKSVLYAAHIHANGIITRGQSFSYFPNRYDTSMIAKLAAGAHSAPTLQVSFLHMRDQGSYHFSSESQAQTFSVVSCARIATLKITLTLLHQPPARVSRPSRCHFLLLPVCSQ